MASFVLSVVQLHIYFRSMKNIYYSL